MCESIKVTGWQICIQFVLKTVCKQLIIKESIQEFGIELITLMEVKPIEDNKSVIYVKNFLEAFCPKSDNYNGLTPKGKDAITQIRNSDNEFIKHVIEKVKC